MPSLITAYGPAQRRRLSDQRLWSRRVVSADRDPTTGFATNVQCDGGAGKAPVACATAPFVYLGTQTPTLTGAVGNTFTIGKRLRFYALVDFKRGHTRTVDHVELLRCTGASSAPASAGRTTTRRSSTPIYLAEATSAALSQGYIDQYYTERHRS